MNIVECPKVAPPYPDHLVAASRDLLHQTVGQFSELSPVVAQMLMARYPDHAERIEASAIEMGVDPDQLFLGNICYDLATAFGCSTLALATAEGPVIARNMDWFPEDAIARASCVLATDNGEQAGFVGFTGVVTGVSNNGFALALNAVGTADPKMGGYPMLLFLRAVIDGAKDFAHALAWVQREQLASGGLITIVGTRNEERAVVERTPMRAAVRRPVGDAPLITTNDYRLDAPPMGECPRYARLAETTTALRAGSTFEEMLFHLTDPRVVQSITAQHVVARPATRTLRMWVPGHLLA